MVSGVDSVGTDNCKGKSNDRSRSSASRRMTTEKNREQTETGNGKSEIQGSLHCATDDETVRCFGRDDVDLGRRGASLALGCAAPAHDGPYVYDLVSLGDVVAVEGVGALVEVGAVDIQPVAEFGCLVAFFPR